MVTRSRQTSRGLLALLATWAVGLPALLHYVGGREAHVGVAVHFWLVAFAALIAAAASIALTVGGARARDSRTVLLYRPAWTVARALGLLRDERGSASDPICVAALERVLTRNQDDPGWVTEFAREPASPRAPAPRR
jgi:hypothetical protein